MFFLLLLFSSPAFIICNENLKYAAVIYRHGDRTPVDTYPTDPWRDESLWPAKFGQLTNVGKMQHYELGKWLQKRYLGFLSNKYNPTEVFIRSTDVDRTLMSAQANLAGMYPPSGKAIWNHALLWQPIPVHTVPEREDEILAMEKDCPSYDSELAKLKISREYKDRLAKYQSLMNYLSEKTGLKVANYYDIYDIYSILYIESLNNFTLPNWTNSVYPDKLREPASYNFVVPTLTPILARLKVGPLIREIVNKMVAHISSEKNKTLTKVDIYSGHDLTIASVLNGLGMFDVNCPPFAATILMELTYDNTTNTHYIRIIYKNSTDAEEPHVLPIPYCDVRCPIEKFITLYENLINVNWSYECGEGYSFLVTTIFCVVLLMLGFAAMILRNHFIGLLDETGYVDIILRPNRSERVSIIADTCDLKDVIVN